jgi:hypothetical protein
LLHFHELAERASPDPPVIRKKPQDITVRLRRDIRDAAAVNLRKARSLEGSGQQDAVGRAPDSGRTSVKDVRVNHRRAHVLMTEQLLDGPDVVALFQEVGREGVPEGVAGGRGAAGAPAPQRRGAPPHHRSRARSQRRELSTLFSGSLHALLDVSRARLVGGKGGGDANPGSVGRRSETGDGAFFSETKDAMTVTVELPGVDPEEIEIALTDDSSP